MGWPPDRVEAASRWQFAAAWRGWKKANLAEAKTPGASAPTPEQHRAAMAFAHTIH